MFTCKYCGQKFDQFSLYEDHLQDEADRIRGRKNQGGKTEMENTDEIQKRIETNLRNENTIRVLTKERDVLQGERDNLSKTNVYTKTLNTELSGQLKEAKDHTKMFEVLKNCPECWTEVVERIKKALKPDEITDIVCSNDGTYPCSDEARRELVFRYEREKKARDGKKNTGLFSG